MNQLRFNGGIFIEIIIIWGARGRGRETGKDQGKPRRAAVAGPPERYELAPFFLRHTNTHTHPNALATRKGTEESRKSAKHKENLPRRTDEFLRNSVSAPRYKDTRNGELFFLIYFFPPPICGATKKYFPETKLWRFSSISSHNINLERFFDHELPRILSRSIKLSIREFLQHFYSQFVSRENFTKNIRFSCQFFAKKKTSTTILQTINVVDS